MVEEEADMGRTWKWNGQAGNRQAVEDRQVFGAFVSRGTVYIVWVMEGRGEDGS